MWFLHTTPHAIPWRVKTCAPTTWNSVFGSPTTTANTFNSNHEQDHHMFFSWTPTKDGCSDLSPRSLARLLLADCVHGARGRFGLRVQSTGPAYRTDCAGEGDRPGVPRPRRFDLRALRRGILGRQLQEQVPSLRLLRPAASRLCRNRGHHDCSLRRYALDRPAARDPVQGPPVAGLHEPGPEDRGHYEVG